MKKIINLLFPEKIYCICCSSLIDGRLNYPICNNCIQKFHWVNGKTCEKCGKIVGTNYPNELCKDCIENIQEFDKGYSCSRYGLYERTVMMDFKYGSKAYIGRVLGKIMGDRIAIESLSIDYIVPVPIHKKRLKKRGYNQAEILAEEISKVIKITSLKDGIIRNVNTVPMRSLNLIERRINMEKAFKIDDKVKEKIQGKSILIVDDIYTTGSTINSLALLMKDGGAREVNFLVFASGQN